MANGNNERRRNHEDDEDDDGDVSKWHLIKGIPVALLIGIGIQTGGAIWWFATLSSKLDRAIEQIAEFKQDRYTKEDGRRDQQLLMQMMESLRQSDRELERRVLSCENTIANVHGAAAAAARNNR